MIYEIIREFAVKNKKKHENISVEGIQLLDNSQAIRRLKIVKPYNARMTVCFNAIKIHVDCQGNNVD